MHLQYDAHAMTIVHDGRYADLTVGEWMTQFHLSSSARYKMLQEGRLLLNNVPVKHPDTQIHDAQIAILHEEGKEESVSDCIAEVIYEDAFVYAVSKPAGLIIHSDDPKEETLARMAAAYQKQSGILTPVRPLHRLDKDTAGIVLFSKVPFFQPWYDYQLSVHTIQRRYLAAVKGNLAKGKTLVIDAPLGKDRHRNNRYRVFPSGKPARTDVECLERQKDLCLLRCTLHTGRTHQIRVHLASRNLPIVNDPFYGVSDNRFENMGLWAYEMVIFDPLEGKKTVIHDHANPDFARFGCLSQLLQQ